MSHNLRRGRRNRYPERRPVKVMVNPTIQKAESVQKG